MLQQKQAGLNAPDHFACQRVVARVLVQSITPSGTSGALSSSAQASKDSHCNGGSDLFAICSRCSLSAVRRMCPSGTSLPWRTPCMSPSNLQSAFSAAECSCVCSRWAVGCLYCLRATALPVWSATFLMSDALATKCFSHMSAQW
eukprot:4595022-Amphidinium_carterae.2